MTGEAAHRGMAGMRVPFSSTKCPPALRTQQWCRDIKACRAVVGLSLPFWLSAFFRGENSSSRSTSYTTNFLGKHSVGGSPLGIVAASPARGGPHSPSLAHTHRLFSQLCRREGRAWSVGSADVLLAQEQGTQHPFLPPIPRHCQWVYPDTTPEALRAAPGEPATSLGPTESKGHTWKTGRCQRQTSPS